MNAQRANLRLNIPPRKRPSRSTLTPLWVISAFLSLTEAVAALALTQATDDIQVALTAFVIFFPILVAAAFFAILWFRPYVLYPPTEYGDHTDITQYVTALGGRSSSTPGVDQETAIREIAQREVNALLSRTAPDKPSEEATEPDPTKQQDAERVMRYFAFRGLRFTDVTNSEARAIFNLGAYHGFNLFDGEKDLVFLGYFLDYQEAEIAVRLRFLLQNIDLAYRLVDEKATEPGAVQALELLSRISIVVVINERIDPDSLRSATSPYMPTDRDIPVTYLSPRDIANAIATEVSAMGYSADSATSHATES